MLLKLSLSLSIYLPLPRHKKALQRLAYIWKEPENISEF